MKRNTEKEGVVGGDLGFPTHTRGGRRGAKPPVIKLKLFFHTIWNSQYRHDEILDFSTLHYYS